MTVDGRCVVLWQPVPAETLADATVFSFLSPHQEATLVDRGARTVVSMSRLMDAVSREARELYIDLVADIGLCRQPDGRTVRAALRRDGTTSTWWYHPATFRNSENEPVFAHILGVLAITREAQARGFRKLQLVGPPPRVVKVLENSFEVEVLRRSGNVPEWLDLVRALFGRTRFLLRMLVAAFVLRRHYVLPSSRADIALQGYWDWSVFPDPDRAGGLVDRYFGKLPEELRKRDRTVAYWCWYDPWSEPAAEPRSHRKTLEPLNGRTDVLLLPALLSVREILSIGLDFSAFSILRRALRNESCRGAFRRKGTDFLPLLKIPLLRGALSAGIPECRLVELAAGRAQSRTNAVLAVRFQEHNPPSRAVYAALKDSTTTTWAAQHASYSSGKTYLAFHPEKEFGDQEDNQAAPHPERVCVMGEFGRQLFRACGYRDDQLLVTGSARYDAVRPGRSPIGASPDLKGSGLKILVATSLPAAVDVMLAEAVVDAVAGMKGVAVRIRQHPFDRIEKQPGFGRIAGAAELSRNSLSEDLAWSDLVVISQSTVGEEAFLAGRTVWQVRFPHPNQSALAEFANIPRFYTVAELREAIIQFAKPEGRAQPDAEDIERVYRALFQKEDSLPSVMIAEAICAEHRFQGTKAAG